MKPLNNVISQVQKKLRNVVHNAQKLRSFL